MSRKPDTERQAGDSREPLHETDVLLSEVSPQMMIEGALVLRAWLEKDPDYQDLSLASLVGKIYSRMRMFAADPSVAGRCRDED